VCQGKVSFSLFQFVVAYLLGCAKLISVAATTTNHHHFMAYLTISNTKIQKGIEQGYLTFGIHFAPARLSGLDVCSHSSQGCRDACLNFAGRGQQSTVQKARVSKTQKFLVNIKEELQALSLEIKKAIKKAIKQNLIPCFRLNLTSDLPWEKLKLPNGNNLFEEYPTVQFYDYTKNASRMHLTIPNYHLTFSRSEDSCNQAKASVLASLGKNVAVVFSTKKKEALPETFQGLQVVDGDKDDLRFLDAKGAIVGLRAKGKASKDNSGFVVQV